MHTDEPMHGPRVGLGITESRDALATVLDGRETTEIDEQVPDGADVCLLDEGGFERHRDAVSAWHARQDPVFAPVMLLVRPETENPYERYADDLATVVDAVERTTAPAAAIAHRVETLLERRRESRQLSTEQQLNAQVFDTGPMAKVVMDSDGSIVRANQRATAVLGVSRTELTRRAYDDPSWEIVDEDGEPLPDEELPFAEVMATGEAVYGVEHSIRRDDGERAWLSINAAPIRDETGDIEYVIATIDDSTEQRVQERELERQVDLFEKAQDIAGVGAWEYDVEAAEGFWTDEAAHIHGLPTDIEPSPELSLEHFHPDDRPVIEAAFERAVEDGESYDLELRLIDDQGDERWVQTRGEPQYDDGELVRVRGTIQDITDRKERESELQRMSHAVDEAPIGVSISDPAQEDNPLVYVNKGFLDLTGYDRADVVGRNCRFLQGDGTDPDTVAEIREAIDAEQPVSTVIRNYGPSGTAYWNRLEVAPVRDDDGTLVNWIGFQQDVTERVERERQLSLLDRYLRHNLRNKMNVVTALAELIQAQSEPPLADYADQIETTGIELLQNAEKERTVTAILRDSPDTGAVDLMRVLGSVTERVRPRYPDASITVSGPPSMQVRATDRLGAALEELVQNGLEHNDSDAPTVQVDIAATDAEVTVRIEDDGPGIPPVEVDVLKGAETKTDVYHGQGMGLWLVYLVVRRCGGHIEFETGDEGRTVATVGLPAA